MYKEVIAIDIGGTHMRFAKVKGGRISEFSKFNTPKTKKEILNLIEEESVKRLNKKVRGVGISWAGTVKENKVIHSPNLPIQNFNLKKYLEKKLKTKVNVENDANCFALAEIEHGSKRKNFIVITLGTGIGGGIVINRKLYKGRFSAGEFGHSITNDKKDLEWWYQKSKIKKKADYVGQGIASLTSILDPEEIIIDGGMKNRGEKFLDKINKSAEKYKFVEKLPRIKFSSLKHSGIKGSASLI